MEQNIKQKLTQVLHTTFGFSDFRPGQFEALNELMSQGRLLCIQPTGHGKSLLYQLPAVVLEGITLVISPLLALMRDQLKQLKERFGITAASFNTDQTMEENNAARNAVFAGKIRILFIAPEQLEHIERVNFLLGLPIQLLVVDEAHCISTWGHDFRPSYRQILHLTHALIKKNPAIKLLALTATANKKTEADIKQQLIVDNKSIVVYRESMDRPNIRLSVIPVSGTAAKLAMLTQLLANLQGCGLIYCATRENTEMVADFLMSQSIKAAAYHAGLEASLKQSIQYSFIHDAYNVISATNALGMGIDKPNLRFIIHFDHPSSITAYYQEVGRSGRDGLPAEGILLYDPADSRVQRYFIDSAQPKAEDFAMVLDSYFDHANPPDLSTLKRKTGLHPTKLLVIIAELVEQGFLKKESRYRKQVYVRTEKRASPDLNRYIIQRKIKNSELKAIQLYAEQHKTCLMTILRHSLGDNAITDCGRCSICMPTDFKETKNKDFILATLSWLERRTIPIVLNKKIVNTTVGIAVLDGKSRSEDFVHFMRERAQAPISHLGLSDTLFELIKECLYDLVKHHPISCIVPLPSRTWYSRDDIVKRLASYVKIPALFDLLYWTNLPAARQGELLNNDQRRHNVINQMMAETHISIPKGTILLFDDYVGSGATLNEAARALQEHCKIKNTLLPFTVAAVKWRLGKRGMI